MDPVPGSSRLAAWGASLRPSSPGGGGVWWGQRQGTLGTGISTKNHNERQKGRRVWIKGTNVLNDHVAAAANTSATAEAPHCPHPILQLGSSSLIVCTSVPVVPVPHVRNWWLAGVAQMTLLPSGFPLLEALTCVSFHLRVIPAPSWREEGGPASRCYQWAWAAPGSPDPRDPGGSVCVLQSAVSNPFGMTAHDSRNGNSAHRSNHVALCLLELTESSKTHCEVGIVVIPHVTDEETEEQRG
ncbi:uncharacterized protein LOC116660876 [Camelus ferus]|uniref:Uncharacterized protein LOC116660876 n=1 Tax=Camelus ferus TaxID=419612 RepID=A0A8B8SAD8_CAMFR|nr:uncharacterized protein LOC116660876 [Camelus ferus]